MCPMGLRLTVLAIGLLLPLTACSDDAEPSPDTQPGDTVAGRIAGLDAGKPVPIVTPAGRLSVAFADPVKQLADDKTTDLRARNAPEGGAFVPIVWSFEDDEIFGVITRVFGDRKALELELVVDGEKYALTPPSSGSGKTAEYVAVDGKGDDVRLDVTYNGVTQTLDGQTGELEKGVAADLYDLPALKVRSQKCPIKKWLTNPQFFVNYQCTALTAVPTPYIADTWAEEGHTWLAVRLQTTLSLFATGSLVDAVASYDAVDTTDLTTIDGKKPLGTLEMNESEGTLSGILVFDIEGELPKTMDVLRQYKLVLSGAAGETDAPERRSVKIGGELPLRY